MRNGYNNFCRRDFINYAEWNSFIRLAKYLVLFVWRKLGKRTKKDEVFNFSDPYTVEYELSVRSCVWWEKMDK